MKVLLYGDWPLALTYLDPLYEYIRKHEPSWDVWFDGEVGDRRGSPKGAPDVVVTCDELSAAPDAPIKVCIFHGMASKAQAFSSRRQSEFVNRRQDYAVPSDYHADLLRGLGVSEDRIFVSGLTKHDQLERRILYAPTHNEELSAIPVVRNRIYEIRNVRIQLHMYLQNPTLRMHESLASHYPVYDTGDPVENLKWADTVIGDMGSIVMEALALGKRGIQVRNPMWRDFYRERGIQDDELERLPEVRIPNKYGLVVHSVDELLEAVNIAPVGGASQRIVDWINGRR